MTERATYVLSNRQKRADVARLVANLELGTVLEIKGDRRSLDQNRALHGLIDQILKVRKTHNGVRMDRRKWKAVFLKALGDEIEFLPTLDGDGMFPLGLSTRELSVKKFTALIELILAWTAREGIAVKHFAAEDPGAASVASGREAA